MKEPIEPGDIRKGDLIRKEYGEVLSLGRTAIEYQATSDAHGCGGPGQHFLLDRPEQPLLGDEWRLGWIECENPENTLGFWRRPSTGVEGFDDLGRTRIPRDPRDFMPATAVPTEALDELRANPLPQRDITVFLAAVDEANA